MASACVVRALARRQRLLPEVAGDCAGASHAGVMPVSKPRPARELAPTGISGNIGSEDMRSGGLARNTGEGGAGASIGPDIIQSMSSFASGTGSTEVSILRAWEERRLQRPPANS